MRLSLTLLSAVTCVLADGVNPKPKRLAFNLRDNAVAWTPASNFVPYQSQWTNDSTAQSWIQIDLGQSAPPVESVVLYPMFVSNDQTSDDIVTYGFPVRYKIEVSDNFTMANPTMLVDRSLQDQPNPENTIITHNIAHPPRGHRYFRFTATKLGMVNRPPNLQLGMTKIEVISRGADIALRKNVTVDPELGYQGRVQIAQSYLLDAGITDTASITRDPRGDGEGISIDNPRSVIPKNAWKPPKRRVKTPLSGVSLTDGALQLAFNNNIGYLLDDTLGSVEKLTVDFRNRTYNLTGNIDWPEGYWYLYPGSNGARFLQGASNALRWTTNTELQSRVTQLVDAIAKYADDSWIMAFPLDRFFDHQNAAYGRAWLTRGLLDTGYSGNSNAFKLLRKYYDWFNTYKYLDKINHGASQGGQGSIASTLLALSPVGVPEDVYVTQRYFQENYWIDGLAKHDPDMIWQYPYDHPHAYLITGVEPYFDLYLLTGDERYYAMVDGFWKLFRDHWINIGGATSIIEFGDFPPDSQTLNDAGELCGSSFWIRLNQRFHWLHPTTEAYVAEIEKSIYNVIMGNQVNDTGLLYHAKLTTTKDFGFQGVQGNMINTCCEAQGTRSLGSLPEFIYSTDADSGELYVNMFAGSKFSWQLHGHNATIVMDTAFPYAANVSLSLTELAAPVDASMYIRIPGWATDKIDVHVNGKHVASGTPGTYEAIRRTWRQSDTVTFTLPIKYSLVKYTGRDQVAGHTRYGLLYGPVLMAISGPDEAHITVAGSDPAALFDMLEPGGQPLHSTIKGMEGYVMKPYWQVGRETFTSVPVIDTS